MWKNICYAKGNIVICMTDTLSLNNMLKSKDLQIIMLILLTD